MFDKPVVLVGDIPEDFRQKLERLQLVQSSKDEDVYLPLDMAIDEELERNE